MIMWRLTELLARYFRDITLKLKQKAWQKGLENMFMGISGHWGRACCPRDLVRGVVVRIAGKYFMWLCPALLFPLGRDCTLTM